MFSGIDIDFYHFIETEEVLMSLYVNVNGNFSKFTNDLDYSYTISDSPSNTDMYDVIKVINSELFTEIENLVATKVDKYIVDSINEERKEYPHA